MGIENVQRGSWLFSLILSFEKESIAGFVPVDSEQISIFLFQAEIFGFQAERGFQRGQTAPFVVERPRTALRIICDSQNEKTCYMPHHQGKARLRV